MGKMLFWLFTVAGCIGANPYYMESSNNDLSTATPDLCHDSDLGQDLSITSTDMFIVPQDSAIQNDINTAQDMTIIQDFANQDLAEIHDLVIVWDYPPNCNCGASIDVVKHLCLCNGGQIYCTCPAWVTDATW